MDAVTKTGWWANSSGAVKGLIITLGVGIVITAAYFGITHFTKGGANSKDKSDKGGNPKKSDTDNTKNNTPDKTKTDSTENTNSSSNTQTNSSSPSTSTGRTMDASELPSGGKGCSTPRLVFDGDYDYVKCGGTWFTKSKPNPRTASTKGSIKDWKNLGSNKVATQKLDSRYPND